MDVQKEREAFEQLEGIAAMMAENPGIEFENGKYVYYGLDGRTAFAAVYISGAWAGWQAAKAQAVPESTNQTFEDWLSDPENTKVHFGGYRERADEFAHQAWMASLKAKLPKDKILMPRSLDQKHIDYVVHQLAISSGASLISEVYECLIEAQGPK